MKFKWMSMIIALVLVVPAIATAGAFEGSIQSFTCITQGKVCPVGKEDPMIAVERVFVLHVKAGEYYFIPNVDRAIMARHLNELVKVEGEKSANFNSIKAVEIYVMEDGKWVKTWSQDWQDQIYEEIASGKPLTGA